MALIPIRIPRTSKPPVGTPLRSDGHWSVQGLVSAYALNDLAGVPVDSVVPRTSTVMNGATWQNAALLTGVDGTLGVNISGGLTNINIGSGAYTFIASITVPTLPISNRGVFGIGVYDPCFAITKDTGTLYIYDSGGKSPSASGIVAGIPQNLAYVRRNTGANGVDYYIDAQYAGSTTHADSIPMPASLSLGSDRPAAGQALINSLIHYSFLFSRILSQSELAMIKANPWQIYEPEIVWVEVGGSGVTAITATLAIAQPAQTQATTGKLVFSGSSTTTQQPQTSALSVLLSFRASTAEMQAANLQAIVASLSFSGSIGQIQQAQQQAIYQSLLAISGAVSQTQAAQISSLTASLIFGGTSEQTQTVQASALAAVLRFTGATDQAQAAQEQAIVAILGEVAITGTINQSQAIQLATLSASLKFSASVDQSQAAQTQTVREFLSAVITGYGIPLSVAMPQALRVSVPLRLPPASVTVGLV